MSVPYLKGQAEKQARGARMKLFTSHEVMYTLGNQPGPVHMRPSQEFLDYFAPKRFVIRPK